jgi:hypothetical protein
MIWDNKLVNLYEAKWNFLTGRVFVSPVTTTLFVRFS